MDEPLILRVAFAFLFVVFMGIRGYYARKSRIQTGGRTRQERIEAIKKEGKSSVVLLIGLFWASFIVIGLYLLNPPWMLWSYITLPSWISWIGVVIGILSIPYLLWVQRTLDLYWTLSLEIKEEHKLITSGPYSRMRHPMYSSHFLWNIALFLISLNLLLLTIYIIAIPLTYLRMFKEENMMMEQFGEEYEGYMKRTGRVFPRLSG